MQLAVADIESDHASGAPLEQDVGEPARGGADVEAVAAARIDLERVERVRELLPAARDEPRRRLDLERRGLVHLRPRLLVPGHAPGEDERLRLGPALREPALDEQDVEPLLHAARRRAISSSKSSAIGSNTGCGSDGSVPRRGSRGTRPSGGTPSAQIARSSDTGANTSIVSPQCGQTRPDMFSMPPTTSTPASRRNSTNFRASRWATSCGPTTTTAPSSDTTSTSCCCRSAVPGGRAKRRRTRPPHSTLRKG